MNFYSVDVTPNNYDVYTEYYQATIAEEIANATGYDAECIYECDFAEAKGHYIIVVENGRIVD